MDLIVQSSNGKWQASLGDKTWSCAIGKNGTVPAKEKVEGDGKTPIGSWALTKILYRADRISLEQRKMIGKSIEIAPLCQRDGWCDEPEDPYYNKAVIVPYTSSYEVLWKEQENTYDLIGLLSHNSNPVIPGLGSAIFLHVAKPDMTPTEGCVALEINDLLELLSLLDNGSKIKVIG
ncbi:ErfK/YbiS/YcfS/YnhG family protein [Kiloniella litopenaei]|uniref:ErfK/YbiS/YcfS/YnhG family protein n=1 Tax=Kiloniella litopenaei TaxID=1549748 RepID=A0A0M2R9H0_9PROT|nr:L,D-transpeptidase family protein [Kiloniella litopenaei]KKJ77099.1 ErfK/YbiS/YcfS/YnhG family protein [Kiloniella litopenaei]